MKTVEAPDMRQPRMRLTVRMMMVAIAGLAVVCGGMSCFVRMVENRLVVENRSGQPILWLRISMYYSGPIAMFKDLPDGGAETASFRIRGDDSFALDGILADGTRLSGDYGYVTNGQFGVHPRFI